MLRIDHQRAPSQAGGSGLAQSETRGTSFPTITWIACFPSQPEASVSSLG